MRGFSRYKIKELMDEEFPLELKAGESRITHYILDVPLKPWSMSIRFVVEKSAGVSIGRFTLSWR